jgi:DNA-binding protein Fis
MIPSINAMIRAANQLAVCEDESDTSSRMMTLINLPEKAAELARQAHDFMQVKEFLKEQVALRQPHQSANFACYPTLTLAECNRMYARNVLAICKGNKTQASKVLGVHRQTVDAICKGE